MDLSQAGSIENVNFNSCREFCAGQMYWPGSSGDRLPCVIMANGFSATMDWILPEFARRFAESGFAVLTFDYRYLGQSPGYPRQIVDVDMQRADLKAAIAYIKSHARIDSAKIALWGTSLGASHVLEISSHNPNITAVILNVPALDALRGGNIAGKIKQLQLSIPGVLGATIRLYCYAVTDFIRSVVGAKPLYISVFGKIGKAFFADPRLKERFALVAEKSKYWQNRIAARFLLRPPRYRHGTIEGVVVPILACLARDDIEISNAFVQSVLARAVNTRIVEYPCGHFDIYHDPMKDRIVHDQIEFLKENVSSQ